MDASPAVGGAAAEHHNESACPHQVVLAPPKPGAFKARESEVACRKARDSLAVHPTSWVPSPTALPRQARAVGFTLLYPASARTHATLTYSASPIRSQRFVNASFPPSMMAQIVSRTFSS